MSKPRLLDLFCGAGGAAEGYRRAGFDVVGVDIKPQPRYPIGMFYFTGDALEVLRSGWVGDPTQDGPSWRVSDFDAIHASPPCQAYSTMSRRWNGNADKHPKLIARTRELLMATGLPHVIENVPGAPLYYPIRLCGSSFGLGVRRHRMFEFSVEMDVPTAPPCDHNSQPPKYRVYDHGKWYLSRTAPVYGHGGGKAKEQWSEAMGIDWMSREELTEAIPPAYTEFVGARLLEALAVRF